MKDDFSNTVSTWAGGSKNTLFSVDYQYPDSILVTALEHDRFYLPITLKKLLGPYCEDVEAFIAFCLQNGLLEENGGQYGLKYKVWEKHKPAPGIDSTPVVEQAKCTTDLFGNKGTVDQNGNVVYLTTQDQIREFHIRYSSDQVGASAILGSVIDSRIKATPPYQTGHILDREVSIYGAPATNKFGKPITIRKVLLNEIRSDKHAVPTRVLRSKPTTTKQEVIAARVFKQLAFDYVSWSCVSPYHHDGRVESYSGVICLDADHLPDTGCIQQLIKSDPAVIASFVSPSGTGLKILYETDSSKTQQQWYKAYAKRLLKLTGLPENYVDPIDGKEKKHIDPTCSNISRACFLPTDPSIYINPALL